MKRVVLSLIIGIIVGIIISAICIRPKFSINCQKMLYLQESFAYNFRVKNLDYAQTLKKYNLKNEYQLNIQIQNIQKSCELLKNGILDNDIQQKNINYLNSIIAKFCNLLNLNEKSLTYQNVISSIPTDDSNNESKLSKLYVVENLLIQDYLTYIYSNSIIVSRAELINISQNDTINLGESYSSQLVFSSFDITGNKDVYERINENEIKQININESCYKEKPNKKGHHHHNIMVFYNGFYETKGWETSIDYYVR